MYNAKTPPYVVDSAIQALANLLRDECIPDGAQDVVTDNLAGVAMSMGCIVPIVSYISRHPDSPKAEVGRELISYLLNRGAAREEHWANLPATSVPVQEEPVAVTKGGKAQGRKSLIPDQAEVKPKDLIEAKGRPDPNQGPSRKLEKPIE